MHLVSFPGLGIGEFPLNRVAFHIGSWPVYWYGIIIAAGFLLAVVYCGKVSQRFGIIKDSIVDMLFFAVPLSIVGARLYYLVFNSSQLQNPDGSFNFIQIFRIWDGGLAIYGGIIAAVITLFVFCRIKKIKFLAFADLGVHGLLIGQCIGRWGNFTNVEAYGAQTTLPWRMGIYEGGQFLEVHPTFLYESLWNLAGFFLLSTISKKWRKFDGQIFLCYFLWYGIGRFLIEGLRTDSLYLFNTGIRVSQALALFTAVVAALLLVYHLRVKRHTPAELWVNQAGAARRTEQEPAPQRRVALIFPTGIPAAREWADTFHRDEDYTEEYTLPEDASPDAIEEIVNTLKQRDDLTGVLVWSPSEP